MNGVALTLLRSARLVAGRVDALTLRVQSGDESAWLELLPAITALAALAPQLTPESRGELLTTKQMAERLGVTPKALLRRRQRGQIQPAVAAGKLIRWRGTETLR